jgi:hypothetical protein
MKDASLALSMVDRRWEAGAMANWALAGFKNDQF